MSNRLYLSSVVQLVLLELCLTCDSEFLSCQQGEPALTGSLTERLQLLASNKLHESRLQMPREAASPGLVKSPGRLDAISLVEHEY